MLSRRSKYGLKALLVLATAAGKSPAEARREIDNLIAKAQDDAALLAAAGTYLAAGADLGKSRALLERSIQLDPKARLARQRNAAVDDRQLDAAQIFAQSGIRQRRRQELDEGAGRR